MKTPYSILSTFLVLLLLLALPACQNKRKISPELKTINQSVFTSGYLEQEDVYVVAATTDGVIQELNIREGDEIKQGQMLVLLSGEVPHSQLLEAQVVYEDARNNNAVSAPQLAQIQAQIDLAKTELEQDKLNYLRYSELREKNSVSPLDLEKATLQFQASKRNLQVLEKSYIQTKDLLQLNEDRALQEVKTRQAILNDYRIPADKNGLVLEVLKKKGELVRKGEVIAKIGSGDFLLKLFVAEEDITKIALGQQAMVQMNNYPDTSFGATVSKILPEFNESEQSFSIEAVFSNSPALLLSGTQLQAIIQLQGYKKAVMIPTAALIRGRYVQLDNGEEREIKTGLKSDDWIEIKQGLTTQDLIVLPH